MLSAPDGWPRLGTDRYPWYPQVRVFEVPYGRWDQRLADVAAALKERFPAC
jgi:hypothetical protein